MNKKRSAIFAGLFAALLGVGIPIFFVFGGGTEGYKTTPNGLQYRIIKDAKQRKGVIGDVITAHITYKTDKDSTLFSSREINGNKPVEIPIAAPQFKGDLAEGYTLVGSGDSAEFKVSNDSIFKGQKMPPFAKPGGFIHLYVQVVSVMSKEEYEAKKKAEEGKQKGIDEDLIQKYIKDKGLTNVQKTSSGLYYITTTTGSGAKVEKGNTVSVNYTGKLLDGTVFDSNTDPEFHHAQPFDVQVGVGKVIKGWDEGLTLFNVGSKGTLLIPSGLAYGSHAAGPKIPANSVLVFDVEILSAKAGDPTPAHGTPQPH